jgi:hypothetical protein
MNEFTIRTHPELFRSRDKACTVKPARGGQINDLYFSSLIPVFANNIFEPSQLFVFPFSILIVQASTL